MPKTIVYIADNQYLAFVSLSSLLRTFYGVDVVVEQAISREILEFKIAKASPTLVVVDYANFDLGGVSDISAIQKLVPRATILVVSDEREVKQIKAVVKTGIAHYVLKSGGEDDFENVFKAIEHGRKYISGEVYDILLQKEKRSYKSFENQNLSNGEIEIVRYIANGKTTKEIAEIKHLSFHTINTHRKNIFRKLNITNSAELVRFAINTGLISEIEYYI